MTLARKISLLLCVCALTCSAQTQSAPANWVTTWGASQQIPEPANALAPEDLTDATLRQVFHVSTGGSVLRVHFSNAFGTEPLHISSAHIARPLSPSSAQIDPATDHPLSFSGNPDVFIPPGAEFVSDPLEFAVAPLSDLAVSFYLTAPPDRQTGHPGSRATSYYIHGDRVSWPSLAIDPAKPAPSYPGCDPSAPTPCKTDTNDAARHLDHWYTISAIDVEAPAGAAAVVALGDSITDGHGATTNGNDRWTDVLAQRLQAARLNIGVSNQGIGGNHLLTDGLGPNALARFDRDVLAPAGVQWLIVFEGVNDLGGLARTGEVPGADHAAFVQKVLAAYQQIVARAHAHGLRVYGATITPYVGSGYYHPGPLSEADRQAVNTWIRAAGHFDAVIDFDAVVRDPQQPDRLLPLYDCGDHLHPSPAGYKAMATAIPLSLFVR